MNDPYENEVRTWMRQFAAIDDREHRLPDPTVIWLKAQVMQSARDVERASRPITTAQIGAYAVVAGAWAALLTWKWAVLQSWLTGLLPRSIIMGAAGAQPTASISITFLLTLVILGSATVMLAMHTILAEE